MANNWRKNVLTQTRLFLWKKGIAAAEMMSQSSRLGNVQGTLNTKKKESERTTQTVKEVEGVSQ